MAVIIVLLLRSKSEILTVFSRSASLVLPIGAVEELAYFRLTFFFLTAKD
ncbi:hypothetical protein [[Phormidium ambiguum] IAM M-71]|nr:hypothetical protein [Phormidium ambiguum]